MQPRATASYLILSSPRSGTNLICRGLEGTGLAGRPREYLNPRGKFWRRYGADAGPADVVHHLLTLRASPNGVFGAKVFWRHLAHLERICHAMPRYRDATLAAILADLFPRVRYVRVLRRDKLRQAVSYWKAYQSGVWGLTSDDEPAPARTPEFDYDGITAVHRWLLDQEARLDAFCAESGIAPLTFVYEEFTGAYEETIRAILDHLDLAAPDLVIAPPSTVQQADAESEAWLDRYRRLQEEQGETDG